MMQLQIRQQPQIRGVARITIERLVGQPNRGVRISAALGSGSEWTDDAEPDLPADEDPS